MHSKQAPRGLCATLAAFALAAGFAVAIVAPGHAAVAPPDSAEGPPPRPCDWRTGDEALVRAILPADSVVLHVALPDEREDDLESCRLADGERVRVIDARATGHGCFVLVRSLGDVRPSGWVQAAALVAVAAEPEPAAGQPVAPPADEGWSGQFTLPDLTPNGPVRVLLVVAGTLPLTRGFEHEYDRGGVHLELDALQYLGHTVCGVAGVGFWSQAGSPRLAYTSATRIEVPSASRLEWWNLAVRVGAVSESPRGKGLLMAGPALFVVHERAQVDAWTREADPLGATAPSLTRLAAGAVMNVGAAWAVGHGCECGLLVELAALGWKGHERAPLATDAVLDGQYQIDVGLTFGAPTRWRVRMPQR